MLLETVKTICDFEYASNEYMRDTHQRNFNTDMDDSTIRIVVGRRILNVVYQILRFSVSLQLSRNIYIYTYILI